MITVVVVVAEEESTTLTAIVLDTLSTRIKVMCNFYVILFHEQCLIYILSHLFLRFVHFVCLFRLLVLDYLNFYRLTSKGA